jgi:hypothetical protein
MKSAAKFKIESGAATVYQHRAKTQQYIEIYEKMLQHGIFQPKGGAFNVANVSNPQSLSI